MKGYPFLLLSTLRYTYYYYYYLFFLNSYFISTHRPMYITHFQDLWYNDRSSLRAISIINIDRLQNYRRILMDRP